ncbi:MAG: FecR domain-containing protein [Salinibacter sp.]
MLLIPGQSRGQTPAGASKSTAAQEARADEGRPLAFVRRFKPQVSIFNRASQKYLKAEQGQELYDGDTLATGENGYAAVQFMDKSLAKVKPNSVLIANGSVDDDTRSMSTRILLNAGEVLMNVNDAGRSDFEVATSSSVATVKGTEFISSVSPTGQSTHYVFEGTVSVLATESGQTKEIGSGMYARVDAEGETITTGQMDKDEQKKRRKEFNKMEEKMQPKTLKLRFRDEDGNIREVEIKYYENKGEQNDGEE